MKSVRNVTQPRRGYLPLSSFKQESFPLTGIDWNAFSREERAFLCKAADAYLRWYVHEDPRKIFKKEAIKAKECLESVFFERLLEQPSIESALRLSMYSQLGKSWHPYKSSRSYKPTDSQLDFIAQYVSLVERLFQEKDGISERSSVFSYDGCYITSCGVWLFRLLNREPTPRHTLQLLEAALHYQQEHSDVVLQQLHLVNLTTGTLYSCALHSISTTVLQEVQGVFGISESQTSISTSSDSQKGEDTMKSIYDPPKSTAQKDPHRVRKGIGKTVRTLLFWGFILLLLIGAFWYIQTHTTWFDQGIEQFKAIGDQLQLDTIFQ